MAIIPELCALAGSAFTFTRSTKQARLRGFAAYTPYNPTPLPEPELQQAVDHYTALYEPLVDLCVGRHPGILNTTAVADCVLQALQTNISTTSVRSVAVFDWDLGEFYTPDGLILSWQKTLSAPAKTQKTTFKLSIIVQPPVIWPDLP